MNQPVLKLTNLSKTFKATKAVDKVDMTIQKGDIYGLIGKNGAGKTTLIRMITSMSLPDQGEIQLFGETSRKGLQEARRRLGCVIEAPALYPNLSAAQNLEYYQRLRGIPDKDVVQKTLAIVGLEDVGKKKFKNFSLGMKQRLGIAQALLTNPDFLILDEPINGLDPVGIVEMRELIKRLNEEMSITILISSHLLTELSLVATRYGIIHQGRMIKELTHNQLEEACQNSLVFTVDNPAKAAAIFEGSLKTTKYKVTGSNEIRLFDRLDEAGEINYQLVTGGVRVTSVEEIKSSLEDYFVELVKEGV